MNLKTDHIGTMVAEDFRTAAIFKNSESIFAVKAAEPSAKPVKRKILMKKKFILKLKICRNQTMGPSILLHGRWIC